MQGTTGIPPSELLMDRQLRIRLDFVIPDLSKHVQATRNTIMINTLNALW